MGRLPQTPGQNLGPKGEVASRQAGDTRGVQWAASKSPAPGRPPLYAAHQLGGSGQAGQVSALSGLPLGCELHPPLTVVVKSVR